MTYVQVVITFCCSNTTYFHALTAVVHVGACDVGHEGRSVLHQRVVLLQSPIVPLVTLLSVGTASELVVAC